MNAELLWSLLVKGSVVIAMAALASMALRRTSAARRHVVWLATLWALLLLPLAAVRLPSWSVSAERTPVFAPLMAPMPLRQRAPVVVSTAAPVAAPAPLPSSKVDPAALVMVLWCVGFFGSLGWLAVGLGKVLFLIRSGRPWASEHGARVLLCPGIRIPATAGILRPVILLPEEATDWPIDRLQMVLAHETAHIRRRDWFWQVVSQAACAVHFFNPLAWLAARRLRVESEFACDENAAKHLRAGATG